MPFEEQRVTVRCVKAVTSFFIAWTEQLIATVQGKNVAIL